MFKTVATVTFSVGRCSCVVYGRSLRCQGFYHGTSFPTVRKVFRIPIPDSIAAFSRPRKRARDSQEIGGGRDLFYFYFGGKLAQIFRNFVPRRVVWRDHDVRSDDAPVSPIRPRRACETVSRGRDFANSSSLPQQQKKKIAAKIKRFGPRI